MQEINCQSPQQAFFGRPCWQWMVHDQLLPMTKLEPVYSGSKSSFLDTELCMKNSNCCMQDVFQEDEAIQVCIYCHHPCDAEVSGFEPAWTCAWCRVHAHVSCYQAYHDEGATARRSRMALDLQTVLRGALPSWDDTSAC